VNIECPAQAWGRLTHFASRAAMDIAGLGDRTASALLELGLVADPGDIYALTKVGIARIPGFKDKAITNLQRAIETSKTRGIDRLLFALSIRHLGDVAARRLADHFGSIDSIQSADMTALTSVPGLGPVIAASVHDAMRTPLVARILDKLRRAGVRLAEARTQRSGPLAGRTFVLTGALEAMTREAAVARLEDLGGTVSNTVSKKTSFLMVGKEPGTKLEKARRAGVPLVDEPAFLAFLADQGGR